MDLIRQINPTLSYSRKPRIAGLYYLYVSALLLYATAATSTNTFAFIISMCLWLQRMAVRPKFSKPFLHKIFHHYSFPLHGLVSVKHGWKNYYLIKLRFPF
jgi:hypothetical protein